MVNKELIKSVIADLVKNADEFEIDQVINVLLRLRDIKQNMKIFNIDLSAYKDNIVSKLSEHVDVITPLQEQVVEEGGETGEGTGEVTR